MAKGSTPADRDAQRKADSKAYREAADAAMKDAAVRRQARKADEAKRNLARRQGKDKGYR